MSRFDVLLTPNPKGSRPADQDDRIEPEGWKSLLGKLEQTTKPYISAG